MRGITFAGFMTIVAVTGLTLSAAEPPLSNTADSYDALKQQAEEYWAEGSYRRANKLYTQAARLELSPTQRRWVEFRVADTQWRGEGGTSTADDTRREQAVRALQTLIDARKRVVDRDRVWAEAHESRGDYEWQTQRRRSWHPAWQHYSAAMEWWASSPDIDLARTRYLHIVRKTAEPLDGGAWQHNWDYHFGYHSRYIPLQVLENALKISRTQEEKALSQYLLAMHLRHQGDWRQQRRIAPAFDAALEHAADTEWYDDALFYYAQWLTHTGRPTLLPTGGYTFERDYIKAVELYRRLFDEFDKGETRFFDRATNELKELTSPRVGVFVSNVFVPDSEIQFQATWRNVETVTFSVFPVSLVEDIDFKRKNVVMPDEHPIDLAGREPLLTWRHSTGDKGDHVPGQDQITIEDKLPTGAYVLEARAEGERAHALLMVTDIVTVLKTSESQALVYVCGADDGAPRAGANVTLWQHYRHEDHRPVRMTSRTNDDGLAVFELPHGRRWREVYVAAQLDDRQSFARTDMYYSGDNKGEWRIYVFTDRPAYRPGDWARWKLVARHYHKGTYSTPADRELTYRITDACGNEVDKSTVKFNAFGSGWGTLELTDKMALGEFHVEFHDGGDRVGQATMFRLEEYKLPEFKVTVETPQDEQGQPRAYRLGESVEVEINAEYYFGGPVADADVRVIVYQSPYYHYWSPPREFGWYYDDMGGRQRYWGYGQQTVKDERVQTDADGKATIRFDTPEGANQDFQYRIEARVTDASRREIVGTESLRVTRQSYYVNLRPEHNIYRPRDTVKVEVKALDANQQPQSVDGTITLTREHWSEVWLDSDGNEVTGDKLRELRKGCVIWPPIPEPGRADWRLKFRGYEREELLTQTVKTDKDGNATFKFEPDREGFYRCKWVSIVEGEGPILAETTAWVATKDTRNLGFRPGGVDIIVDRDTFRSGQNAPVMLTVPTNDRYVLFTLSADDLYSYQVIHVTGDAKLLEVPITAQHVPNVFLDAAMVSERQIFTDTEQVVVPPVEEFLTVDVEANKEAYEPREEGTLTVRTRDCDGNPVSAEVALSLSDESVYYIQQDYAGDVRQFFYGRKRGQETRLGSMLDRMRFTCLVRNEHGKVVDEISAIRERYNMDLKTVDELSVPHGAMSGEDMFFGYARGYKQRRRAGIGGIADFNADGVPAATASRERMLRSDLSAGDWAFSDRALNAPPSPQQAAPAMDLPESEAFVPEETVQVRTDFRATALWEPLIVTDADGYANVPVKFPDSLTSWRAMARAATTETKVGIAEATVRTRQPLIVRLQAPRFFLVGDTVTISAVMNNNTDEPMRVLPAFTADGIQIESWRRGDDWIAGDPEPITIEPNADARVDWRVRVTEPGTANLKVLARGEQHADAMQREFVVHEHGIDKLIAKSGKVRGRDVAITLDIPAERKPESTTLTVQITPSIAVTMLDALPYLVDYPYGCMEQTMSRFLPAVITAKTLNDLGLDREIVANKLFGGIEQDEETLKHVGKRNLDKLDAVVEMSLKRLYGAQRNDGGWGWWKGKPEQPSDHFMSAYVAWGLVMARDAGIEIDGDALKRGVEYLQKEIVEEELQPDSQAWMLYALAVNHEVSDARVSKYERAAFDNLYKRRDQLNAYTRALLALSAHYYDKTHQAQTLARNLEDGVIRDDTPDTSVIQRGEQESHAAVIPTAHWGEDGVYYRWSDGGEEATAFALRALLAIDPDNALIEPVTNWLVKNRRGAQWRSTRDTAIVVLALNDYLRVSGELSPEMEYELLVNGQSIAKRKLTPADAFSAPSRYEIDRELIRDGANEIRIKRTDGGPLYFAAEARFYSLEVPIPPAGNEIFVRRQYYKLVERQTLLRGTTYERVPLNDGDSIVSGERVESVITIEAKNNYEYLIFEDLKPAGFESVELRSGSDFHVRQLKSGAVDRQFGNQTTAVRLSEEHMQRDHADYTGKRRWVHRELRDRKVAMFIDQLPEGIWEMRYELRAEVPGQFHAMPTIGQAMYVPEIRCNGAEIRVTVQDTE